MKMGDAASWNDRIAAISTHGLPSMEDAILGRWFGPRFRNTSEAKMWGAMLYRTPQEGYLGCYAAIANSDLTETTRAHRLPTLAIVGSHDGASPPDLVAAAAALITNSTHYVIEGAGHLLCVEDPAAFAAILNTFLKEHAYV